MLRFTVQCLKADTCTVYFEPEGAYVELSRRELITVEMSGGEPPMEPEIAFVPDGIRERLTLTRREGARA